MAYPHVDSITAKPKMLTYWGKGENFSRKFKEGLIGNILKKTEKKKKGKVRVKSGLPCRLSKENGISYSFSRAIIWSEKQKHKQTII